MLVASDRRSRRCCRVVVVVALVLVVISARGPTSAVTPLDRSVFLRSVVCLVCGCVARYHSVLVTWLHLSGAPAFVYTCFTGCLSRCSRLALVLRTGALLSDCAVPPGSGGGLALIRGRPHLLLRTFGVSAGCPACFCLIWSALSCCCCRCRCRCRSRRPRSRSRCCCCRCHHLVVTFLLLSSASFFLSLSSFLLLLSLSYGSVFRPCPRSRCRSTTSRWCAVYVDRVRRVRVPVAVSLLGFG